MARNPCLSSSLRSRSFNLPVALNILSFPSGDIVENDNHQCKHVSASLGLVL